MLIVGLSQGVKQRTFCRSERFVPAVRRLSVPLAVLLVLLAAAPAGGGATRAHPSAASALSTLRRTLAREQRAAGGSAGIYVLDLSAHRALFASHIDDWHMPASVEKLYTTSTALIRLGPSARLVTQMVGHGSLDSGGSWRGDLYLKGSGDPTFGSSAFDRHAYGTGSTLQRLIANLLVRQPIRSLHGRILGDETVFDRRRGTPATGFSASSWLEGLLGGLIYNRGLADPGGSTYQARPARFAAARVVDALRASRVKLPAKTGVGSARAPRDAVVLASVSSPPIATLVRLTNSPSDNFFAEMLLKVLGARIGRRGTTSAGAAVVRGTMAAQFGLHPRLEDGSGLSRNDRTTARQIVALLSAEARNRPFVGSLSLAGHDGTTASALRGTPAQGRCRSKTGSLHDVGNLAGYCTAHDGHTLAYAFLIQGSDPYSAHVAEYAMAVALARYNG